jgi:transcription antitermination factor NusG
MTYKNIHIRVTAYIGIPFNYKGVWPPSFDVFSSYAKWIFDIYSEIMILIVNWKWNYYDIAMRNLSWKRLSNYFYYHVIKNSSLWWYVRKYRTCSTFHGFENVIVNRPPVKTKDNEMKRVLDGYTRPFLYRYQSHDIVKYCHMKKVAI